MRLNHYAMLWQITKWVGDNTMSTNVSVQNVSLDEYLASNTKLWRKIGELLSNEEFILQIPNKIFDYINENAVIVEAVYKTNIDISSSNKALLFAYWCVTKIMNNIRNNSKQPKVPELKQILRYSPTNCLIDKFIKKDGIADQMGLTSRDGNKRVVDFGKYTRGGNYYQISAKDVHSILYLCNDCKGLYLFCYILYRWKLSKYHKRDEYVEIENSAFKKTLAMDDETVSYYVNILVENGFIEKISGTKNPVFGGEFGEKTKNSSNKYRILKFINY